MADVLFSASPYGKALFNAYGARKPTMAILGDSYGSYLAAAIQYACARYYAADIHLDLRDNAGGGRLFSVGGSSSSDMVTTQLPQFVANPADVAWLWSGYNSTPSSLATAITEAANITNTAAGCLAAGAKMVIIMGQSWRGTGSPTWIDTVNTLCRDYAMATPGVTFCDITPTIIDPTGSSTTAVPYRTNYARSDAVHPSGKCVREGIAPVIWPLLERIARKRLPRAAYYTGMFHATNSPDAEVLGGNSLMLGTGGAIAGGSNSSVAGSHTIDSGGGWNLVSASVNGITITPTITTGPDGFKKQRLAFSGTVGGGGATVTLSLYAITAGGNTNGGNSARLYDAECLIDLVGVTGLNDISISSLGITTQLPSQGTSGAEHVYPDATTETQFLYTTYPLTSTAGNGGMDVVFYFTAGKVTAGYVEIGRASVKRIAP